MSHGLCLSSACCGGKCSVFNYLALNHQSCEDAGSLRDLARLCRRSGSGLAAVVLLCGVIGRALAPLLAVRRSVLGVGQRGADPGAGVPGLPSQPRDVPLQQAPLDDAVRLLWKREDRFSDVLRFEIKPLSRTGIIIS